VHAETRAVSDMRDPAERARAATQRLDVLGVEVSELSRIRREALETMASGGMTHAEIARKIGVTRGRIGQLIKSGPPPERAFLGVDRLVIVVAGKVETDRPDPRPVVAEEDMIATERLDALARSMQLPDSASERIAPGEEPDLTRPNLVVICGPRHSAVLRQVLRSDRQLSFAQDEAGWHLVDHATGTTYRSRSDSGQPGDVGYLGRLPRPDAGGTFLYLAGIHAAGAAGVVHYVEHHLAELYHEVGAETRFSTLIGCEYDPHSHEVTDSTRLTPIYRPEAAAE
jgi:hypothetical protein